MHARIVRDHDWRRIEDDFERAFGHRRPRDGLTAVYYRIRTRWGLAQVLKSGSGVAAAAAAAATMELSREDVAAVHARAAKLDQEFLQRIGYG